MSAQPTLSQNINWNDPLVRRDAARSVVAPYETAVLNAYAISGTEMERVLRAELGTSYQEPFDKG